MPSFDRLSLLSIHSPCGRAVACSRPTGGRRLQLAAVVCGVMPLAIAMAAAACADEQIPADAAPRWWKGNIHTHTLWSDGNDFPEMVAEWYRTHDYNFLALSDHNVLAQGIRWMPEQKVLERGGPDVIEKYLGRFGPAWVDRRGEGEAAEIRLKPFDEFRSLVEERGQFLMIPAEEISDAVDGKPVHINASNVAEEIRPVGGQTVSEAIQNNLRAVQEQAEKAGRSILAHLNHPNFGYAVTPADLAHATLERHFEVFNGHPSVNQLGSDEKPSIEQLWDIANTIRLADLQAPPLFGVATDDSHDYHSGPGSRQSSRPGRGWVMVRASHLTPEKIIQALQAGNFYSSSGVTLRDVQFDDASRTLQIDIEPDGSATYSTRFLGSLPGENGGPPSVGVELAVVEGLSASYTLSGNELYVRAVISSSAAPVDPVWEGQQQQAWTQPVGWQQPSAGE
jgi:hypothetical protein